MKFGIHNSSWLISPDPAEAFEAVKAKAQWAEDHGFVWFSVLDHMIQIPRVGAPDEPFLEGWTVLSGLAAVTSRIRLATLATAVGYRNPAHLAKIAASVDLISRGRLTLGIGAGFFSEHRAALCRGARPHQRGPRPLRAFAARHRRHQRPGPRGRHRQGARVARARGYFHYQDV
jgi:alkanesulfonate monooxygenase SsuD/methylene tetrahydromethanopterin reductase-like flavin-dependent oxidoreductase (luciferase family)